MSLLLEDDFADLFDVLPTCQSEMVTPAQF
jgi:hypothetical protein